MASPRYMHNFRQHFKQYLPGFRLAMFSFFGLAWAFSYIEVKGKPVRNLNTELHQVLDKLCDIQKV